MSQAVLAPDTVAPKRGKPTFAFSVCVQKSNVDLTSLLVRLLLLRKQLDGTYNLGVNMIAADDLVDPILL